MYIMQNVSVADARQHLSEILGKVAYGGEAFIITKKGRPMAHLVPAVPFKPAAKRLKKLGEIKGWLEDDDPFFVYIDSIRAAQRAEKPQNPFRSKRRK